MTDGTDSQSQDQVEKKPEPKYAACKRLEKEGRYEQFRERAAFFRSSKGGALSKDEAFYKALAEFPPKG